MRVEEVELEIKMEGERLDRICEEEVTIMRAIRERRTEVRKRNR